MDINLENLLEKSIWFMDEKEINLWKSALPKMNKTERKELSVILKEGEGDFKEMVREEVKNDKTGTIVKSLKETLNKIWRKMFKEAEKLEQENEKRKELGLLASLKNL